MRKIMILTGVFLASLMILSACGKKDELPSASVTDMAETIDGSSIITENPSFSNFKSVTLSGDEVDQSIFAEYDLTMINVWATFCGPCLSEMPDLGEINEEYKDKKFQIVGIVTDVLNNDGSLSESQLKTARDVVDKTKASYMHLIPTYDLQMAKLKDVTVVPTTFFVDQDGNMVGEEQLGSKNKGDWTKLIDEYLGEVK